MSSFTCSNPRDHQYRDPHTREWLPAPCETLSCEGCRGRAVRRREAAIALAKPENFITITGVPPSYAEFAPLRRTLERALQRRGYDLGEWLVTLEVNPRRTGFHANVLHHGDPVPQPVLSELAERSGFGFDSYSKPMLSARASSAYVLKNAIDDDPTVAAEFLAANDGRLTHSSRRFFRDGTGAPLTAVEADELAAMIGWPS